MEVNLPGDQEVVVASHQVPVGEVHKVLGYGLSADNTGVDYFGVKVSAALKANVYTRTYAGGQLDDHTLIDNTGGAAPVDVELIAHNDQALSQAEASGFVLIENVTNSQAP